MSEKYTMSSSSNVELINGSGLFLSDEAMEQDICHAPDLQDLF